MNYHQLEETASNIEDTIYDKVSTMSSMQTLDNIKTCYEAINQLCANKETFDQVIEGARNTVLTNNGQSDTLFALEGRIETIERKLSALRRLESANPTIQSWVDSELDTLRDNLMKSKMAVIEYKNNLIWNPAKEESKEEPKEEAVEKSE